MYISGTNSFNKYQFLMGHNNNNNNKNKKYRNLQPLKQQRTPAINLSSIGLRQSSCFPASQRDCAIQSSDVRVAEEEAELKQMFSDLSCFSFPVLLQISHDSIMTMLNILNHPSLFTC